MKQVHRTFAGEIPEYYDRYLVPFLFAPFADDLIKRLAISPDANVLELACGSGVVTRLLATRLGSRGTVVATDLNQAMIDEGRKKVGPDERILWRQADAASLPFEDDAFDAIVCQFGWMFFPNRLNAAMESLRVLRPGGKILFNTWDALGSMSVLNEADAAIRGYFPENPPTFYDVPFSMHDPGEHEHIMRRAGFSEIRTERVTLRGAKLTPEDIASGIVRGGPFISEIEERSANANDVIRAVANRLGARFGREPFAAELHAIVCSARSPG